MSGSLNKATLIGNVGRDPEIRATNTGSRVASLSLATSKSWKDRDSGERKESTEWHRIVIFADGLVGIVEQYVHKGSKIYVEGELRTRKWTDNNGVEKYTTEIVLAQFSGQLLLIDSNRSGPGTPDSEDAYGGASTSRDRVGPAAGAAGSRTPDIDDEIPF